MNVTVVDVPGYRDPDEDPCNVKAELVPTDPVPVPEPEAEKYAYAIPARATAPNTLTVTTVLLRVKKDIKTPVLSRPESRAGRQRIRQLQIPAEIGVYEQALKKLGRVLYEAQPTSSP